MRVAFLDDYQDCAQEYGDWGPLGKGVEIVSYTDHLADEDEVAERLRDFDVVCAMRERTPFPRSQLEKLPNLKLLITSGMRNLSIDYDACKDLGITLCGTPSVGAPTADLAWGLMLGLARQIPQEDRRVRSGGWQQTIGIGMAGKTLGVLGLGKLGGMVAKIGQAFGMNVIAWSQNLTEERCQEVGATLVSKEDLMKQSDFLTIHLILSDRTRGIVTADDLALMKPTAFLVNTARGPLVDEDALAQILEKGAIAGAGLDVFGVEPLPADHPFRRLENTVITPHLGYVEQDNYRAYFKGYVDAIRGFVDGTPVNVLNS
jgi:phosphoglycerate dehydrogenase-like enzyme